MAASVTGHASDLEVEIIVGSYEQVLFGYNLTNLDDSVTLNLSFTDKSHCASIRALGISKQKLLASGSADETIQLFDLKSRQEAGTLMRHSGTITHIEFYDDFMFSSDDAGVICIWKIAGRSFECLKTLTGHKGSVFSMAVHPSGKLLLSVGHDKTIRTWNLITAKRAYTTSVQAFVDIIKWSPDGEKYVMAYNGKLDVCSLSDAAPINSVKLPGKAHSIAFMTSNLLALGCETGVLVIVDIASGEIVAEQPAKGNRVKCVQVKRLEEGKSILALVTNEGLIELYLANTDGRKVRLSLIAASRTALRPICMEMWVESGKMVAESESAAKKAVKGEAGSHKYRDEPAKPEQSRARKRKRKIADDTQEAAEAAASTDVRPSDSHEDLSATKKVAFADVDAETEPQQRKRKSTIRKKMDSIKKFISSKTKDDDGGAPKKGKKHHMRPVDSVKIAKQKMNLKKQAAQHRNVSEGDGDDNSSSRHDVISEES